MDLLPFLSGERRENILSDDEVARKLRDTFLDLVDYGVISSDGFVPDTEAKGNIKVPRLLRYSNQTLGFLQTLCGVLRSPRGFSIVEKGGNEQIEEVEGGDVLHWHEGKLKIYSFPNELTSTYLNSLRAVLDSVQRQSSILSIYIQGYDKKELKGLWKIGLFFAFFDGCTVFDSDFPQQKFESQRKMRNDSSYWPEKQILSTYYFSPRKLGCGDIAGNDSFFLFPQTRKFINPVGEERIGNFDVLKFHFNATGMAGELTSKIQHEPKREGQLYHYEEIAIYNLNKQGDRDITVVCLGKKQIGNQTFWIYSGSEQPLVSEKESERSSVARPSLVLNPVLG